MDNLEIVILLMSMFNLTGALHGSYGSMNKWNIAVWSLMIIGVLGHGYLKIEIFKLFTVMSIILYILMGAFWVYWKLNVNKG